MPCEWPVLKRFSRSKVKGQGHRQTKCTCAVKAYISTVWCRGVVVHFSFFSINF